MKIRKTAAKNVHPVVAAIAIALTIGAVQYVWWGRLVARPPGRPGGGPQGGAGPGPPIPQVVGLKTVKVDTLAGTPEPGYADGRGHSARFDGPAGIAVDASGAVVVADTRNNCIRLISPGGHTSTLAGGAAGYCDGPAVEARFRGPSGVAVGRDGAIYVADTGNHRVRRIRNGIVTSIGGSTAGTAGGLGSGPLNQPISLALDSSAPGTGGLLIADAGSRMLRRIGFGSGAVVESIQGSGIVPRGVASSRGQRACACPDQACLEIASRRMIRLPIDLGEDTGRFPKDALTVDHPATVCSSGADWFITDAVHASVMRIRSSDAQVIAGVAYAAGPRRGFRDGTGDKALFGVLSGIAADGRGHVYVADCSNNAIRRITLPEEPAVGNGQPIAIVADWLFMGYGGENR
jgi:hypothetical protein